MNWMKENLGKIVAIGVLVAAVAIAVLVLLRKAQEGKLLDEC